MKRIYSWHYTDVPRLGEDGDPGTVIISPDALQQLRCASVDDEELSATLEHGEDVWAREASWMMGRWYGDIRLVLKTWPGLPGSAVVCVNGYRVET